MTARRKARAGVDYDLEHRRVKYTRRDGTVTEGPSHCDTARGALVPCLLLSEALAAKGSKLLLWDLWGTDREGDPPVVMLKLGRDQHFVVLFCPFCGTALHALKPAKRSPSQASETTPTEARIDMGQRFTTMTAAQVVEALKGTTRGPWHRSGDRIVQTQHVTRDVWVIPRTEQDFALCAEAPRLAETLRAVAQIVSDRTVDSQETCARLRALMEHEQVIASREGDGG